jgi:hypothetical protein
MPFRLKRTRDTRNRVTRNRNFLTSYKRLKRVKKVKAKYFIFSKSDWHTPLLWGSISRVRGGLGGRCLQRFKEGRMLSQSHQKLRRHLSRGVGGGHSNLGLRTKKIRKIRKVPVLETSETSKKVEKIYYSFLKSDWHLLWGTISWVRGGLRGLCLPRFK